MGSTRAGAARLARSETGPPAPATKLGWLRSSDLRRDDLTVPGLVPHSTPRVAVVAWRWSSMGPTPPTISVNNASLPDTMAIKVWTSSFIPCWLWTILSSCSTRALRRTSCKCSSAANASAALPANSLEEVTSCPPRRSFRRSSTGPSAPRRIGQAPGGTEQNLAHQWRDGHGGNFRRGGARGCISARRTPPAGHQPNCHRRTRQTHPALARTGRSCRSSRGCSCSA